jgi:hypothetical protein
LPDPRRRQPQDPRRRRSSDGQCKEWCHLFELDGDASRRRTAKRGQSAGLGRGHRNPCLDGTTVHLSETGQKEPLIPYREEGFARTGGWRRQIGREHTKPPSRSPRPSPSLASNTSVAVHRTRSPSVFYYCSVDFGGEEAGAVRRSCLAKRENRLTYCWAGSRRMIKAGDH